MEISDLLIVIVLYPILAGVIAWLIGRKKEKVRDYIVWFVAATEVFLFLFLLSKGETSAKISDFCGLGISFQLDAFRGLHGLLASAMWLITSIYAKEYLTQSKNRYYFFTLLTLSATLGVFLSADLYTTFLFFEIMSLTSFVWVIHDETKEAISAAKTYLAVGIGAGLVMLMGLFYLYNVLGTLRFDEMGNAVMFLSSTRGVYIAGVCLLVGFGAKAGMFGLHIWLPKAYTYAPAPASALLSGMLSKTGIYGILFTTLSLFQYNLPWGETIVTAGIFTMLTGALLALLSLNLKRTLACSSMSQIGFIMTGIGMLSILGKDNGIAFQGSVLHMVNHSLIKLILFIIAGMIFIHRGTLELNELRGYGRKKPLLKIIFLAAVLGIAGVPFFNGYVSKTLIHESIIEAVRAGAIQGNFLLLTEKIFLFCSGLTVAYMLKIFVAIFIEKNKDNAKQEEYDKRAPYSGKVIALMLAITAITLPVIGIGGIVKNPILLEWESLKGGLISLLIGIIVYMFIVKIVLMDKEKEEYRDYWPKWWDVENKLYKPICIVVLPTVFGFLSRICDSFIDSIAIFLRKTLLKDEPLPFELEEGTRVTYALGKICNGVATVKRNFFAKEGQEQDTKAVDYIHKLAVKYEEMVEDKVIIGRSLSFGLLLFSLGLCMTLIYILLV